MEREKRRHRLTGGPAQRRGGEFGTAYVEGSTVRRAGVLPEAEPGSFPAAREITQRNRERALSMNFSYVLFLTIAAVLTVAICINYLRLQSKSVSYQKTLTALEVELSEVKLANDSEYNRIISSVDLEHVKDVAMNTLGMTYASESQVKTYSCSSGDYVKQFRNIP